MLGCVRSRIVADYGLDPMTQSFVQGGAVYPYAPQQIETPEGPTMPAAPALPPIQTAPPPPPPPPQKFDRGVAGQEEAPMSHATPDATTYGLHPDVVSAVQNGFGQIADPFAAGGPVTSPSQVAPMAGGPVTSPSQAAAPPEDRRVSPQQFVGDLKQNAAQSARDAAFAASPEGIAQKADAENRAAIDKERQANADAYSAEAAQNDANAAALKAHNERAAKQAEIDQAKAAQDQANVEKYTQQYAQQIKDAADYKVDTNRDIGTRGLIAIALSGIGDALDHRHGPNTALQILDADIDKRINDQWAKKKSLGEKAAETKGVLDVYRNNADSDRQAMEFQKAAESARLADEIRQIGAQYANPAAKARAEALAAGLDQKAATITQGEAARKAAALRAAQEEADKKAQLGVAYGHLALAQQAQKDARFDSDRNFALKVAELEAAGDKNGAKALKAQQDEINERGVMAPTGVQVVKNPDGTETATPKFAPLTQQDGTPYLMPKDRAKDLGERQAAVLSGLDAVDKLRRLRHDNGGNITNSEDALQATQEYARYIMAQHEAGGVKRLSGEAVELFEKVASGGRDPNSLRAVQATLENGRKDFVDQYNLNLRGANYTGKKIEFPDPLKQAEAAESQESKTRGIIEKIPSGGIDEVPKINAKTGLYEDQTQLLANLQRRALEGDKEAKSQLEYAEKSGSGVVKQAAGNILGKIRDDEKAGGEIGGLAGLIDTPNTPDYVRRAALIRLSQIQTSNLVNKEDRQRAADAIKRHEKEYEAVPQQPYPFEQK